MGDSALLARALHRAADVLAGEGQPTVQAVVCRIPPTPPEFFFAVLFIWSLTVIGEVKALVIWWCCCIRKTKTTSFCSHGMAGCFDGDFVQGQQVKFENPNTMVVQSLTRGVKWILAVCQHVRLGLRRVSGPGRLIPRT